MKRTQLLGISLAGLLMFSTAGCQGDGEGGDGDGDSTSTGGTGDGDVGGDGDGDGDTATGGTAGDGDGDTGGTAGDGDGDTGGIAGDGDGDGTGGMPAEDAAFLIGNVDGIGSVITDADGFTLYHYSSDTAGGEGTGASVTWPDVDSPDVLVVGDGLDAADFGETSAGQATYNDLPLYTYSGDDMPGEATGNSGTWPVVIPN